PQFEVGKAKVGKKGVVRDLADQAWAIAQVLDAAKTLGWHYAGLTWSPLLGPAGNIEYLLWLRMDNTAIAPDINTLRQLTQQAYDTLHAKSAPAPTDESTPDLPPDLPSEPSDRSPAPDESH
ncbi:MAG TPA: hypothetical protein V6C88_13270, partial [Chroococcidiopsis sp.]